MKTERFDDILRRKLQSIEPPFHESDWERMQSFIESKHPPTFWQRYGQAVLYGSGVAVITGLLITNITQLNENKRLLTEIKTVSQQIERQQKTIAVQKQIDTVFVVKYVDKTKAQPSSGSNANLSGTALSINRTKGSDIDGIEHLNLIKVQNLDKVGEEANKSKPKNIERLNVTKISNLGDVLEEVNQSKPKNVERSNVFKAQNFAKVDERLNVVKVQNLDNVGQDESSNRLNVGVEKTNAINERDAEPIQIAPLEATEIADLQTDLADNVRNKKLRVRMPDELVWPTNPKKVKPVRLAPLPLRYQLGLGGSLENNLMGGGLSAEALVGKHWSLNVGLDAVKIVGANFLSDEQFNKKSKQDFRDLYAPRIPPMADILNIRSSLQIIRMPVFLSYRYPIRKDFDFMVSAGSEFDLSVKENITFNFRPNRQEFDTENRKEDRDVPFFNNVVVGLGIEKRWNRLAVQFVPYVGYKTDKTPPSPNHEERDSRPQVGIRLRAMYRF